MLSTELLAPCYISRKVFLLHFTFFFITVITFCDSVTFYVIIAIYGSTIDIRLVQHMRFFKKKILFVLPYVTIPGITLSNKL